MGNKTRSIARIRRHRRVRKFISGTSERPRLNVFKSLAQIYAQIVDDEKGHTLVAASTIDRDLQGSMEGLTKTEQSRLVGEALAKRAKEIGITQVVFDRGGYLYVGRVKALADGARKEGLKF